MLLWQCASLVGTHHNTVIVIVPGQAALSAGTAGSDPQITQVVRLILVVYGQGSQLGTPPRSAPFSPVGKFMCFNKVKVTFRRCTTGAESEIGWFRMTNNVKDYYVV